VERNLGGGNATSGNLSRAEVLRQALHMTVGLGALALVFLGLVLSEGYWSAALAPRRFLGVLGIGALVSLGAAVVAYRARAIDRSGAAAGWVLATAIYAFLGWRGFVLLAAFVVLGSGATRWGYQRKAAAKLAQVAGGRRSARHAVANAGVATGCAVFAATTPYPELYLPAFAAAFAAAAGDTLSSEIGQLRLVARCSSPPSRRLRRAPTAGYRSSARWRAWPVPWRSPLRVMPWVFTRPVESWW